MAGTNKQPFYYTWVHAGKHGTSKGSEQTAGGDTESGLSFWNLEVNLQWHASFKAIHPNIAQVALLPNDQASKYMNTWGVIPPYIKKPTTCISGGNHTVSSTLCMCFLVRCENLSERIDVLFYTMMTWLLHWELTAVGKDNQLNRIWEATMMIQITYKCRARGMSLDIYFK